MPRLEKSVLLYGMNILLTKEDDVDQSRWASTHNKK